MTPSELKAKMKQGQLPKFLVFTGEEWKVQEIFIQQIAKMKNLEVRRIDTIGDIYSKLKSKSIVSRNFLYVVRDDKEIMTNKELQSQIGVPLPFSKYEKSILGDNILIMLASKLDKRTTFYAVIADELVEFEALSPQMLKKYIQREIDLSDVNCEKLIEICNSDYGRILLEIDKIRRYADVSLADR